MSITAQKEHSTTGYNMPLRLSDTKTIHAWHPHSLMERFISVAILETCGEAVKCLQKLQERTQEVSDDAALMFLRVEGFDSSKIENIEVPVEQLLFLTPKSETRKGNIGAILTVANVAALDLMMSDAKGKEFLSARMIHTWHRRLMHHDPHIGSGIGNFRDDWVFSGGRKIELAKHIYTPPQSVENLMADLCYFVNDSNINPVLLAAIAHVQFESIHPYFDGNGRIGRMLVGWILARKLGLKRVPPISSAIVLDKIAYIESMQKYQQGHIGEWVEWFAAKIVISAEIGEVMARQLRAVLDRWQKTIGKTSKDSSASKLPNFLVRQPIVNIQRVMNEFGIVHNAAAKVLRRFENAGVIEPYKIKNCITMERARQWWIASDIIDILEDVGKSYASE